MDSTLKSEVFEVAAAIHAACAASEGGSAGSCKSATLALALALESTKEPIAICQGVVVVDGIDHDHYWCRIGQMIIDPTADQFRHEHSPLLAPEDSLPHYREASFFVFSPSAVARILKSAKIKNNFRPDS